MGTDIHGVFQRKNKATEKWEDVQHNFEMGRHYQLFAVLADVRNGTGFAGVKTGERVEPVAEPRGYPEDFDIEGDDHPIIAIEHIDPRRRKYHGSDDALEVWMGDHSHSWLSAAEMLEWFATAPGVVKTGILDREVYEQWDKTGNPKSWCGGIGGTSVVTINDNAIEKEATPNWTHIRCEWDSDLKAELAYFFDEVARLQTEHGEVRFVFGFDS